LQIVGEQLCETLDLRAGSKVLDVAAGNGMVTLAAARRWCDVTSTDYVPALLVAGRARAEAEALTVDFKEADAENLPFDDDSFDAVVSDIRRDVHAKPGQGRSRTAPRLQAEGQIGLANWTPEGFIGQVFKTLGKYLPPPASAKSAGAVGQSGTADGAVRLRGELDQGRVGMFNFRYRSPEHFLDVFKTFYGPVLKPSRRSSRAKQVELRNDLHALIVRMNRSGDSTMIVPSE